FGSDKIGAREQELIDRIAAAAKALGAVRVKLAAHADRAGSDAYNQRLSEMRARAVKKALSERGVPAVQIDAHSFGEKRPVVRTPDGVSDPRNRVVFVTFEE
ncbi:MAG: OmpA family protein, partial [Alphaproteobacteria bacterium]